MKQSDLVVKACSLRQARENNSTPMTIKQNQIFRMAYLELMTRLPLTKPLLNSANSAGL